MKTEKDWQTVCEFGFAIIIVGAIIFAISGANYQWIMEHGYILNAPALILITFILMGSSLVIGGLKWKTRIEKNEM